MNSANSQWLVVQTKPRQEQAAKLQLENQDYTVFLPRFKHSKRRNGKWSERIEALFPSYLFVQIDVVEQNIAPVRYTRGVNKIVRFGDVLLSVPDEVIDRLKHLEAKQANGVTKVTTLFRPGDAVNIVAGPFEGLDAIYQMAKSEERVIVLLNLLGRQSAVTINVNNVAVV